MKTCFIIMPFSKAHDGEKELLKVDLDYIYQSMIKKAVEEYEVDGRKYFNEVLRYEEKVGSIIKGIIQKIKDADLVIADLTGLNPNVMYELGVRHALKRGTIMLTQNFGSFPSDLRDYMTVVYGYSTNIHDLTSNYENFKRDLHISIDQLLKTEKADSPVLEYIGKKELYINEQEVKALKENALILESLYDDFNDIGSLIKDIDESKDINEVLVRELMSFHLNCFHSKLRMLDIPVSTNLLYDDIINITSMLEEIMKKFVLNDYFSQISIEGESPFPSTDLKEAISVEVLDPIELKDNKEVRYCQIKNVFSEDDFLYSLLDDIEDFIGEEASRLGVEKEIEGLFEENES